MPPVKRVRIEYPAAVTPSKWELADASAIQAVVKGEASPEQQRRAMNWIIYNCAAVNDLEYRPDQRDHAFVSGKRFVGLEIITLIKINVGAFRKKPD